MSIIDKYFWGLNQEAVKETLQILKDPKQPKYLTRAYTLLSRCDKPKELFAVMDRKQFLETWPAIRRYWLKTGQSRDFRLWWESIYEQLTNAKKQNQGEPINELKNIGQTIHKTRIAKGWSQIDLAKMSGLKQPDISKIEKGQENITLLTLIRLGRALGMKEVNFPLKQDD